MIRFTPQHISIDAAPSPDSPRTITGLAAPWGVEAVVSDGTRVVLEAGSLPESGPNPKLFLHHDPTQVVGVVTERVATSDGMLFTAEIAPTQAGDETVALIKMGALDSVSIGAEPTKFNWKGGVLHVQAATWYELSVLPRGAWEQAQVHSIAAQPDTEETTPDPTPELETEPMIEDETPTVEAAAAPVVPTPLFAQPKKAFRLPSPGEYIAAAMKGGSDFAQLNANIRAAAGDVITTDVPGELPTPVLQPIFSDINPLRPLVSAVGTRAMPDAGKVWIRPKITQHTSVAAQASELAGLSATTFVVDDVQVTKVLLGGQATLSEMVVDTAAANMVEAVLEDLAGQYALATENAAVTSFVAAVPAGNRIVLSAPTDPEEVISDLYDAAADMSAVGNYLPTHMLVSPSKWAALGKLVDTTGRPLFPNLAPQNAAGTMGLNSWAVNPLGIQLVVSNQVTTQAVGTQDAVDYMFLFNARSFECYEAVKGSIQLQDPSTLGRTVAFRGYFSPVAIYADGLYAIGPSAA